MSEPMSEQVLEEARRYPELYTDEMLHEIDRLRVQAKEDEEALNAVEDCGFCSDCSSVAERRLQARKS